MHAWLQAMHTLTVRGGRSRPLATIAGSARNGRARDTKSASPAASSSSASASVLTRLDAITGTLAASRIARAHGRQAPCGTSSWTVGHARLVPADADVQGVDRTRVGQCRGQSEHLVRGRTAVDQVGTGDAIDDGLLGAGGGADGSGDLEAEAHPSQRVAAPLVVTQVGRRGGELVEQIPLGAHDLHAVKAECGRPGGPAGKVGDRVEHLLVGQGSRLATAEARVHGGRRHRLQAERLLIRIAPGVKQLQQDPAAGLVHLGRHAGQLRPVRVVVDEAVVAPARSHPADRRAAGDDQSGPPGRPRAVEGRQGGAFVIESFQSDVHRTHDDPMRQRQRADRPGAPDVVHQLKRSRAIVVFWISAVPSSKRCARASR